jgi:hypothetical protein
VNGAYERNPKVIADVLRGEVKLFQFSWDPPQLSRLAGMRASATCNENLITDLAHKLGKTKGSTSLYEVFGMTFELLRCGELCCGQYMNLTSEGKGNWLV